MEQHEERLREMERRFKGIVDDIDRSHLRKMQADMHRCAANCCENKSYSMERNQNCIENCSVPLENAQQFMQMEIGRFQNRWSRCVMECNDKMRDKMGVEKSSPGISAEFEKCAAKCIDTQFELMHTIGTNIKKALASGKFEAQN